MSDYIRVRMANKNDWKTISEFNVHIVAETENRRLDYRITSEGVKKLFKKPEYGFYIVAEKDGVIVGSMLIIKEWSDWRNRFFWWIQSVYVKPEFRRQGVYRRMHDFVKKKAEQNPCVCGLRLYVEKNNRKAKETYTSMGMHETDYIIYEYLV